MFSRLFRYFRPVLCIQFIFKADHILFKHIVSSKTVFKRCYEMCAMERKVFENDTLSSSWDEMCSNWLTQEACSEVDRRSRVNLN